MLSEGLEALTSVIVDATTIRIVPISGDTHHAYVQHGATKERIDLPPPDRAHVVHTVDDIIAAGKKAQSDWADIEGSTPVIWHDYTGVRLVINDETRRDFVTMPLELSEQFKTLQSLAGGKNTFNQKAIIKLLRIDLAGAIESPALIENLRRIKFRQSTDGNSDIQHGKESLGRAIEAEVTGQDTIPEQVTLRVPVYQNEGERTPVAVVCAIDISAAEETFTIKPLPGQLETALQGAQASIRARLADEKEFDNVSVFFGKP